jgi:hypothetical protein
VLRRWNSAGLKSLLYRNNPKSGEPTAANPLDTHPARVVKTVQLSGFLTKDLKCSRFIVRSWNGADALSS